ncbi:hypothetical protein J008_04213 [Cryptococcus neoformans]|nr:hypothetical protein C362_03746 [Cryptococcus neoformans var. grubii Bt1]OXG21356.1 hypothetical protein C367_04161 [Cryptococcus neoformans var. grubii Ze90-1]OXG79557.1 hypothetical protein C349_04364 [Cryptococcus neoformans var. grubii Br795]OXH29670.1 hypothetical protein J008_04213 [Cryptococcus neoformans var. grubii]OXL07352.1 hypothetical protein C348_04464 [Cryptococcus neoformans var. grubii Gb118]
MANPSEAVGIYNPEGAPAIIAFVLFGAVDGALWYHFFKMRPRPKWMRCLTVGCFFMSLGFIIRFSRRHHINAWAFIFETLFILLSPCAFLAELYILVPRMSISLDADDCLIINRKAIVALFITGDIITILAQIAGTALQATFGELINIGVKCTLGGLLVQLACFGFFFTILTMFGIRLGRKHGQRPRWGQDSFRETINCRARHWETLYCALGFSSICMIIRTIYRIIEYTGGSKGPLAENEACFYILDTIPMFFLVGIFVFVWPPRCIEEPNGITSPLPTTKTNMK